MSEEQLKAFLEKVEVDTSLQEKLKAAANSDAVLEIAKEAGFMITTEDLELLKPGQLTEEELDGVTGGVVTIPVKYKLLKAAVTVIRAAVR